MTAPIKPALVTAYGKESWGFVLALTSQATPSLAELTANTGLNLSCMLFGDQEGMTADTEKVTLPRLMCETTQYQSNGATTFTMSDLTVSFDPQAAAGSNGKKAWETLLEGAVGYLWRRQGIGGTADLATGQFVDTVPVSIGVPVPGKTSTDSNGVFTSVHPIAITGRPVFNKAVTA